ncbi:PREDICTED: protein CASC5, partial [Merops nubicus]|uniref:protein CASC5 n=1 Tax=Merops nubicus TaxID=57421 RepID=UPI0004F05A6D
MEKIYADPNMENDNTEHLRGRRLSSILKAPRNPLDDLCSGNELTQDINIEKRRKNSRRVSFANTINCRVFQRDVKNNTAESTEYAADTRNDVFYSQNEEPEAAPCEITGMNTLLHAPIQASVQQTEVEQEYDAENAIQRANRHDTTLIFSEQNEMDMTASHTAVITRDLEASAADGIEKIDITSFLAGLNPNSGKAEMSKECQLFSDPTNYLCPSIEQMEDITTVTKIDFNEFLKSLKSEEAAHKPAEGPEESVCVPSQVSEHWARSSPEFVYSSEAWDTCNVTKVFGGQDDGMEMTTCQAAAAGAVVSGTSGAPAQRCPAADVTQAFTHQGMDMTTSHTAKVSLPLPGVGNQSLNFRKDFPSTELDNPVLKTASNQHLIVQHDPQPCTGRKPVNIEDRQDLAVLQTAKQEARTVSAIPGSISSETVFRGDKTVFFSKCDDMEMTGNYTDVIYQDRTKDMNSSPHKTCEKPINTNSLPAAGRQPAHSDRDIAKSLVSSEGRAPLAHAPHALGLSSGSDGPIQKVTQGHGAASGGVGFDSCTSSVSTGVSKSRLQPRLASSQLVSLSGEKTMIFSGEDMDLTKTCLDKGDGKNVENESAAGVFTSVTCKPHFLNNRATSADLNEQEEMEITKCHAVVIDGHSNGVTAEGKQMHCKTIPRRNQNRNVSEGADSLDMDKENREAIGTGGNIKRSQTMETNTKDFDVIMVDQKLGKNTFQGNGPSSCAKSVCLLQEQRREAPENIGSSASAFVALQSQQVVKSQPLEKTHLSASVSCTRDSRGLFSEGQNVGRTETRPAALAAANPAGVIAQQLQTQPPQCSSGDVTSQSAATGCGDAKGNTKKQTATPLAPGGLWISSNEPAPSGVRGKAQLGAMLGINVACHNTDRQEKTHTLKVGNKVLPTRADSERDFSVGRRGEDVRNPLSVDVPSWQGAGEPSLANPPDPHQEYSQLPSVLGKSVVFPSGENMDLTGNSAVMVPDYNTSVLPERAAVPGDLAQDENKIMSLKKGAVVTVNRQEQPVCDLYSLGSGKKMSAVSGPKHLPFAGEKTTIFSEDADMDITRSHTVSADKIVLQHKNPNDDAALTSGDKTCVFTYSDDMEISRLDTTAVDKCLERAVAQGMLHVDKRTGRRSLKGAAGEKTVVFSLSNENNDMEITQSHTAAIGQEMPSQKGGGGGLPAGSSAPPVRASEVSQAGTAGRGTLAVVQGVRAASGQGGGHRAPSSSDAAQRAVADLEIPKTPKAAWEGGALAGPVQPLPPVSTLLFRSHQAHMGMTQAHSAEESTGGAFGEDGSQLVKQAGQEAGSGSRTIIFPSAEDMEITKTHTAVLRGQAGVQDRESIPAISAAPADKTIVFTHHQDDMEITASHTVAVNNNVNGFQDQEVSPVSTQRPDLCSALSSCRDEANSLHTEDLNDECHTNSKDKPSIPSSASSASALPGEKGAFKAPSGTAPDSIYSVSLPEETVAVQTPQGLDPPRDHSAPVSSEQDLIPPENLKSKRVSFKLPGNGPMDHSEDSGDLESPVSLPIQQPESLRGSPDVCTAQRNPVLRGDSSQREGLATDSGLAGASLVPASNRESKEAEGPSAEGETPPKDTQINSEQTEQHSDSPRDQIGPTLAPELSSILNVCSKLKNIRRRSAGFSIPDQLPKSSVQPGDTLWLEKTTVNEPGHLFCTNEQNTRPESGAALMDADVGMAPKDKYQGVKVPLGIFQPKLPNRRNPSVSSAQDINAKSSEKGEALVSEVSVNTDEAPGTNKPSRQNFSPSQFIAEEFLPVCLEEMDSNESVSSELMENAASEISKKQTSCNENQFEETQTCNTKRALERDEEDLQSPKKVKRDEKLDGEASQNLQVTLGAVSQSQVEAPEGGEPPNQLAKSPDCTHASTSSSLDSVKADTEITIQRSSQMESQLLTDSICEDNLQEKFQNGVITVGEFFTLLQVHIPIQKPRHSHVPGSCAVSASPTPEDLLYSQYVQRPKLRVYEEDCQALAQKIEELKVYVNIQDQLLVNVNRSLWEVMRTCSDEELKNFGAELNKMKSYFTKESKILGHNEKEALYSKLLQSAQEQEEKLQSRIEKVDELIKEAESCLVTLEAGSNWEDWGADCSEEMAEGKTLEEELENLKTEEEELKRELLDLEADNKQMLAQMNQLEEEEKSFQELLERCDFTEWEMTEWSEQQATFNFLYDSVELTVVFGPPIDGDDFGEDPSRKIVSLNFESFLDEEKAPPSSCLVQRLIFQFIESQGCWQEKCPMLYYLPQVMSQESL